MPIPFAAWIFQGIPESLAVATLVFSLGSEVIEWRKVALAGFCQAMTLYLIRWIPLSPYFHVIIGVATLALYCGKYGKLDIELSYIYSLFALLVLLVFEFVFMKTFNYLQFITYEQYLTEIPKRIVAGLPQVGGVFLLAWYFSTRKTSRVITSLNMLSKNKRESSKRNVTNFSEM